MPPSTIGIIGDPVVHSRSPLMHNAAFAHLGLAITYERWRTPATELAQRIATLREPHILGANVTLPHKTAVCPLLDALEAEAARIGAVNTIYKREDGTLVGANTDAPALIVTLQEEACWQPAGRNVVILGASGAARAAASALLGAGVAQLVIANRTLERAEDLLADAVEGEWGEGVMIALALDDEVIATYLAECDLLINATSIGWHADETPCPNPPVGPQTIVYDMVYRPTRLLADAQARGARTFTGMGMLLHQGALAFSRWTNQPAPLAVMRAALERE